MLGNTEEIKNLLLTDHAISVVKWVDSEREATSDQVAKKFNISIQSASQLLTKLYKKCYLRREEIKQDSGGCQYNYFR
jgi:predicted transcriptional regulator